MALGLRPVNGNGAHSQDPDERREPTDELLADADEAPTAETTSEQAAEAFEQTLAATPAPPEPTDSAKRVRESVAAVLQGLRADLDAIEHDELGPLRDEIALRERMIIEAVDELDQIANVFGRQATAVMRGGLAELRTGIQQLQSPKPAADTDTDAVSPQQ